MNKECNKCNEVKELSCFYKMTKSPDGLRYSCRDCERLLRKKDYLKNKELRLLSSKKWKDENPEKIRTYKVKYRNLNRKKIQKYERDRRRENPFYTISLALRGRIRSAVKAGFKNSSSADLLGCTIDECRTHLENQFKDNMSWDNYGDWHIDHIKPCAAFNLEKKSEQYKCFNYTNLQPLWAMENFKKNSKYNN